MSTINFIGSDQNSAHPLLDDRWIARSAITQGSCVFIAREHRVSGSGVTLLAGAVGKGWLGAPFKALAQSVKTRSAQRAQALWGPGPRWGPGAKPPMGVQGQSPLMLLRFSMQKQNFNAKLYVRYM